MARIVNELQDNYALVDRESLCNNSTNVSKEKFSIYFRGRNVPTNMEHKRNSYINICVS